MTVCVGVEHLNLAGLHIYPNPTTDVLHIQQSTQAQLNFKVYDATGRLVFSQFSSESEVVIDVRKLAPGVHPARDHGRGWESHKHLVYQRMSPSLHDALSVRLLEQSDNDRAASYGGVYEGSVYILWRSFS